MTLREDANFIVGTVALMFVMFGLVCCTCVYDDGWFYPNAPADYVAGYEAGENTYPNESSYHYVLTHQPPGNAKDPLVLKCNGFLAGYNHQRHIMEDNQTVGNLNHILNSTGE